MCRVEALIVVYLSGLRVGVCPLDRVEGWVLFCPPLPRSDPEEALLQSAESQVVQG